MTALRPRARRAFTVARPVLLVLVGTLVVAGCGDARKTFGLERKPPDEFAVVRRAPLTMPPSFELRPPTPGAPRPQENTPRDDAAAALFGAAATTGAGADRDADGFFLGGPTAGGGAFSRGEQALLARAGAAEALPNIRAVVEEETTAMVVADRRWVDSLIFWQDQDPPYTVVDAEQEAQRLRANLAEGRPVTEGETPAIRRVRKAPLEGLFN